LLQYLNALIDNPDAHASTIARLAERDVTTNMLSEHLLDGQTTVLSDRKQLKGWWNSKLTLIKDWQLVEEWARDRSTEVAIFQSSLDVAVGKVAERKKK
jgi:hypothetical protein